MFRFLRLFSSAVLLALVAGCSSTATTEPAQAPATTVAEPVVDDVLTEPSESSDEASDDDDVLDVQAIDSDRLLATLADWEPDADGGAIVYVRNDSLQSEAAAIGTDPQTNEPLEADDRVRVGSISKMYTSVMVLQLVEEGLVDLDAPVSTYVADLGLENDVTIRQLLTHRSGIPNYTETSGFFQIVMSNPDRRPTPADLVAYTNGESDFEPDSQHSYSNTNFVIVGMVIEAVREQSIADVLDEHINAPLGLVDTAFADGTFTDVAAGYSAMMPSGTSSGQSYNSMAYGSWAAGALVTTVDELALFLDGLFFGDLLSAELVDEMIGDIEAGAESGLGLFGGPDFGVGHGGSIVGFNSLAQIDLETGEIVIAVVNNDSRSPGVLSSKLTNLIRR